jgi:hypothetical protein
MHKRLATIAAALLALAAAAALASALTATGAQGANGSVSYGLTGSYSTSCNSDVGCISRSYQYAGSASCEQNCSGVPSSGSFTITLSGSGAFPPSPCISQRVSGNLAFTSTDPSFPPDPVLGTLTGRHNVDLHGYRLAGTVSTRAFAGYSVSGFVSFPPSPCSPGTFSGSLTFTP